MFHTQTPHSKPRVYYRYVAIALRVKLALFAAAEANTYNITMFWITIQHRNTLKMNNEFYLLFLSGNSEDGIRVPNGTSQSLDDIP